MLAAQEKNRQLQEQEGSNKELAEERKLRAEENETCAEEGKELTQRAKDAEAARDNIDKEKNILLGEAKAGLYSASLVFRQLLRANASQLRQVRRPWGAVWFAVRWWWLHDYAAPDSQQVLAPALLVCLLGNCC